MSQPKDPWGNPSPPQQQPQQTQPFNFQQPGQVQPPTQGYYQQQPPQTYYQQPVHPQQQPQVGYFGGAPEPKKGIPWWGTAIILVLALTIVVALGAAFKGSTPATQANQPQVVATAAPQPTAIQNNSPTRSALSSNQSTAPTALPTIRSIPTPTALPQPVKGKIGDTLSQNGYIITVNSAEKSEKYGDYSVAKNGNIFLAADITIQSDKDKDISANIFQVSLKDNQGYKYDIAFSGKSPQLASQNDIPKGDKVRGWVTFEVPKNVKGFTLEYKGLFELTNPTLISFVLE
jgi:hypothetical protein